MFKTVFIFLFISNLAFAQQQSTGMSHNLAPEKINHYCDTVLKSRNDSVKIAYNELVKSGIKNLLLSPNSIEIDFDSLKNFSQIRSDDGKLRIITWTMPLDYYNQYKFYGFIQYRKDKKSEPVIIELAETKDTAQRPVQQVFTAHNWYGASYYKVISQKKGKQPYYVLLGWKGNNKLSTKKIIETLYFTENVPVFGIPVFAIENKIQKRVIFEYNAQAVMSLKFESDNKTILFDHLSPADGLLNGNYAVYGPDMSMDGLKLEKGIWQFIKDIDLRNSGDGNKKTEKKTKEMYKPEQE